MILRNWGFADGIVAAVLEGDNWTRDEENLQADCCDVAQMAQILSTVGTPLQSGDSWQARALLEPLPARVRLDA